MNPQLSLNVTKAKKLFGVQLRLIQAVTITGFNIHQEYKLQQKYILGNYAKMAFKINLLKLIIVTKSVMTITSFFLILLFLLLNVIVQWWQLSKIIYY